ncbi:nudix hydrolase 8 [Drosophila guanche]|uniref:Blast:Nudix hydrolase 8 n=2 Tax=Drosophila guanche TaxID=7266 RepID=A0A3B0K549_DROGU|nr:nudix hydrolase 8 [Drosophila guanche]SPP78588.1 blast:Nudix hydrolase 8 [Drosophila guanche]
MLSTAILGHRTRLPLQAFNSWRRRLRTNRSTSVPAFTQHHSEQATQQHSLPFTRALHSQKAMDSPPDVFIGLKDRFEGVTVDGREEKVDKSKFEEKLRKSLEWWTSNKNRAIWFRVYKEQADWVPILAASGFDFHHARTGMVVMYRWLPTHESSNLPNYAHTLLGVGGLVINDKDEVLVVSDRYAMIPNSWKLPGGYVEPRENLIDAAIREVEEETGIRTTFRSVVCLRHAHGGIFGCSDIYMVIALKPINLDFTRCEREIARLQWMPIAEYLQHPQVHETNRQFVHTFLDYQKRGLVLTCRNQVHQVLKREYNLYFVDGDTQAVDDGLKL